MIRVNGRWYDGRTSQSVEAVLEVSGDDAVLLTRADDDACLYRQEKLRAEISDRLADTPRFINFESGGTFETGDNAGVDRILRQIREGRWSLRVHALETRKRYILVTVLLAVLLGTLAVKYAIPVSAGFIAPLLPYSAYSIAESQTLQILDKMVFKPSELEAETRRRVLEHLAPVLEHHAGLRLKLEFRKGAAIGPNAFALPAGTVVFTDELVKISEHDDELLAIFVHEAGHISERHAMRRVIQGSLLSFALLALTGDSSGVSELFLGLPVMLTEYAYSREFENDADRYALNYMLRHDIAAHHFADILTRIETGDAKRRQPSGGRISSYISTHPPTEERIKPFMRTVSE